MTLVKQSSAKVEPNKSSGTGNQYRHEGETLTNRARKLKIVFYGAVEKSYAGNVKRKALEHYGQKKKRA